MIKEIQIQVLPKVAATKNLLKTIVAEESNIKQAKIKHIKVLKRSIDARQKVTKINLKLKVYINETFIDHISNNGIIIFTSNYEPHLKNLEIISLNSI